MVRGWGGKSKRLLVCVLLAAAVVRGGVACLGHGGLSGDPDAYAAIGDCLLRHGTFGLETADGQSRATAFRPPLYPTTLAMAQRLVISLVPTAAERAIADHWASRLAIASLHWLLGMATVGLTYALARRLLAEPQPSLDQPQPSQQAPLRGSTAVDMAAAVAALLVIVDPMLLRASTLVMTETLAAALATLALWGWAALLGDRWRRCWPARASLLGVVLALAYLARPTFIVWTGLLCGLMFLWGAHRLVAGRRHGGAAGPLGTTRAVSAGQWLLLSLLIAVPTGITVSIWSWRNHRQLGQPVWATTHGGYTLLLGNNPHIFDEVRHGAVGIAWDPEPFFQRWALRHQADPRSASFWDSRRLPRQDLDWVAQRRITSDEIAADRLAYETAIAAIGRDRSGFLLACLWRLSRLFGVMPQLQPLSPGEQRSWGSVAVTVLVTLFYSLVGLAVLLGLWRLGRRLAQPPWAAAVTLLLALAAVHCFYWTNMRMRAPATAVLAVIAAAPLVPSRQQTP